MITRRRIAIAVVSAVLALAPRVVADPEPAAAAPPPDAAALHVPPPWQFNHAPVCTVAGLTLELPPGYYLAESAWTKLDLELTRAQDAETRLTAENAVFRRHASAGTLSWKVAALLAATSFGAGIAAEHAIAGWR